jgi:hypothetical protein
MNSTRFGNGSPNVMPRFQTVRRARFVYSPPYTVSEMQGFGQLLADTIRARIQAGQNIYDQAAAPLKSAKAGRRNSCNEPIPAR